MVKNKRKKLSDSVELAPSERVKPTLLDPVEPSRRWIWSNGSVLCDRYLKFSMQFLSRSRIIITDHSTERCTRKDCQFQHRVPLPNETRPLCYYHFKLKGKSTS